MRATLLAGTAMVALIVSGCSPSPVEPEPGTTAPSASSSTGTTTNSTTSPGTTTDVPVGGGSSTCVDDSVVQQAVGSLEPFMASAWRVDGQGDPCATLSWATASVVSATGSSPKTVLFFHDGRHLGTTTSRPYAFTSVAEQTDDTVTVQYKWLNPDDATAHPTGGPALVRYRWNGSSVEVLDELPDEVVNPPDPDPAPTGSPGPSTTTDAPPPSSGLCLDDAMLNAVLAPMDGGPWQVASEGDRCATLTWVMVKSGSVADDAPTHVLFFHDGQPYGSANGRPYPYVQVASAEDSAVTLSYRWRTSGDVADAPSGGPAQVRYVWSGFTFDTIGAVPVEVTG